MDKFCKILHTSCRLVYILNNFYLYIYKVIYVFHFNNARISNMNNSKKPLRNYFNNINEKLRYQILVAKLLRNAFSN